MIPKIFFIAVNLICIAVSAHLIVSHVADPLGEDMVLTSTASVQEQNRADGEPDPAVKPISAYQAVFDRHLFSTPESTATSKDTAVNVDTLEKTRLALKLWGTVSGRATGNYAVIEDLKTKEQNLYKAGDVIQTATVKDILRGKVVLTQDGKDEMLQMQEMDARPGQTPAQAARSPVMPPLPNAQTAAGTVPRALRIPIRRNFVEAVLGDPAALATQAKVEPHLENGTAVGIRVSDITPNSIFRRLGLRNGDLIIGMDDTPVNTTNDVNRLIDGLKSAETVSLQIKRRDQEHRIEYSIK